MEVQFEYAWEISFARLALPINQRNQKTNANNHQGKTNDLAFAVNEVCREKKIKLRIEQKDLIHNNIFLDSPCFVVVVFNGINIYHIYVFSSQIAELCVLH